MSQRVIVKARCEVFKWVIEADLSLVNEDKCCRSSSDYFVKDARSKTQSADIGTESGLAHETEGSCIRPSLPLTQGLQLLDRRALGSVPPFLHNFLALDNELFKSDAPLSLDVSMRTQSPVY